MSTVLKFCLYFFAGLVCLAALVQVMDSFGIRQCAISALRRVSSAICHTLGLEGVIVSVSEQIMLMMLILFLLYLLFANPVMLLITLF